MTDAPTPDRRKSKRIPYVNDVEIAGVGMRRCSDLGLGGMYLESILNVAPGTKYDLRFKLDPSDDHPIEVRCRVLYEHPGIGIGVAFENLSPDDRNRIQAFLDRLESQG